MHRDFDSFSDRLLQWRSFELAAFDAEGDLRHVSQGAVRIELPWLLQDDSLGLNCVWYADIHLKLTARGPQVR